MIWSSRCLIASSGKSDGQREVNCEVRPLLWMRYVSIKGSQKNCP